MRYHSLKDYLLSLSRAYNSSFLPLSSFRGTRKIKQSYIDVIRLQSVLNMTNTERNVTFKTFFMLYVEASGNFFWDLQTFREFWHFSNNSGNLLATLKIPLAYPKKKRFKWVVLTDMSKWNLNLNATKTTLALNPNNSAILTYTSK